MSHQISLKQLRKAVAAYQVSKRSCEDIFNIKHEINRYFTAHVPLFGVVDGELKVNPAINLYIAWKDSKPVFYWCFNADAPSVEMALRNEYVSHANMNHRSVQDWLEILERNEITQLTASQAVNNAVVTPLLGNCECHMLPEGYTWFPVISPINPINADDHVTFSYSENAVLIAYGDYKSSIPVELFDKDGILALLD